MNRRQVLSGFLAAAVLSSLPAAADGGVVVLPEGARIKLRSNGVISSSSVHTGGLITFKVVEPVVISGVTIIEKDALAQGVVMFADGAGIGHGGQLLLSIDSVQATDGSWIPLSVTRVHGDSDNGTLPDSLAPAHTNGFPNGKDKIFTTQPIELYLGQNCEFTVTNGKAILKPHAPKKGDKLLMPHNTVVLVNTVHDLSTKNVDTGAKIDFVVSAPVKIQGITLIAKGARAHGRAALANSSDIGGRNGQFILSVDAIQTVDNQWVPVRASQASLGQDNVLLRTGLGILTPVAAILPGHNAIIKATQVFTMLTHKDVYVTGKA